MCGGQVARHQFICLTLLGKRSPTTVLAPRSKNYICLHVKSYLFFFPLSPEIIVFVSQLPLMMQPCFAAKVFGDFRINIKKEIEKAIESV